jgi:predicted dehydrogenase
MRFGPSGTRQDVQEDRIMSTPRTRVALIGAGVMACRYHYPSLTSFDDVELVGISDLVEDKAQAAAAQFGIPAGAVYVDYRRLLAETQPDAVYILMPPQILYEPVHHALTLGLHVFVEKPLALTTTQARMLAYTAGEHDCLTMVGFQRRHVPAATALRARVEERGPIHFADISFLKSTADFAIPAGFYDGAIDPLTSDGIHAVDTLRWLCGGEVEDIQVQVRQREVAGPVANAYSALVSFSSGAVGAVHYNLVTGRRIFRTEFSAINTTAYVDADRESWLVADGGEPEVTTSKAFGQAAAGPGREIQPQHWLGFWHEHRHFIDCLGSGAQPGSHFADAVKSMELVERILASTNRSLRVSID